MSKINRTSITLATGRQILVYELPLNRPVKIKKAVRVGGDSLLLGEDGNYYAAGRVRSCIQFHFINEQGAAYLKALCRLGVITQEEVDGILVAAKKREATQNRTLAADQLRSACKTLGIKTPRIPRKR